MLMYSFSPTTVDIHAKYIKPACDYQELDIGECLGGSVSWTSDFGSGHDLIVRGFEPRIGLCADSSEPGACFGFCLLLPLPLPPLRSVSIKNK